jgi:purine-binding chemotaxis protein CheW
VTVVAAPQRYGSFVLGDLHLALPMEALREVVPCDRLIALPCNALGVVGGIDLRGVVVPVLDLRLLLGHEVRAAQRPCVIVMVHQGDMLGLLADAVSGVFAAEPSRLTRVSAAGAQPLLFDGCLHVDDGDRVSVLVPAALAQLPQVPRVRDPEPRRQMLDSETSLLGPAIVAHGADVVVPMMLVRCGQMALGIDAIAVHCTLSDPHVRDSVLAHGACRGVLDYAATEVPALDLLALCGIGSLAATGPRQAFVIKLDGGMVAFLVDAVMDIVPTTAADVIALPAFTLPRPQLFAGVLPASLLLGAKTQAQQGSVAPCLLLDSASLRLDNEVLALASVGSQVTAGGPPAGRADAVGTERTMLTYDLDVETATPLDQVSEILPYAPASSIFPEDNPMLGVMVNRGRSIPVICLGRLHAGQALARTASASVLVVESEGELVGFVVAGLKAIEPSLWQPELQHAGMAGGSRRLALVGDGLHERMLPVLDLQQLAQGLRQAA